MSIKQMWRELLNKKWDSDDLFWLILMILITSVFTTPFWGFPIGIVIYFLLFYKDEDFDVMAEEYDYQDKK